MRERIAQLLLIASLLIDKGVASKWAVDQFQDFMREWLNA